jgi:hypothetical protein
MPAFDREWYLETSYITQKQTTRAKVRPTPVQFTLTRSTYPTINSSYAMEVTELAFAILPAVDRFVGFTREAILTAREPSKLYDTALSWRPLLRRQPFRRQQNSFRHVFDVPLSTGKPVKSLLTVTKIKNADDDTNHAIDVIPAQEEHTLRVYFVENFDSEQLSPVTISPLTESGPITSQWSSFSDQSHWEIDSYNLSLKPMLRGYSKDPYIDSVSIAAGTIRKTMKCVFHSKENGRVICKLFSHA